jgi:hypothetical protein
VNRYEALKHAVKAHAGQVDKCGQPYILHPIAVAEAVERTLLSVTRRPRQVSIESAVRVALLHDVLEDTDYRWSEYELSPAEWFALRAITREDGETYAHFVDRVAVDPLASIVKLGDLWHNLSPERQDCLPESERKGLEERYLKARERIWEALGYEWWPAAEREGE